MTAPTHTPLPPMAATVLGAGSPQGALMRYGKEPKRTQDQLDGSGKQTLAVSTAIYDGLAVLYTEAEVGAMLVVELPNRPTMGNLNRILKGRGLVIGEDYVAYRAKFDVDGNKYATKERPLVLEKHSDTPMKLTASKVSYGREMASQARERGEASHSLTHARPQGQKGRKAELDAAREQEALRGFASLDSLLAPTPPDLLDRASSPAPMLPVSSAEKLEQEAMDALGNTKLPSLEIGD